MSARSLTDLAADVDAAARRITAVRHAFFGAAIGACDRIADAGDDPPYWACGAAEASLKAAADSLWEALRHLQTLLAVVERDRADY